MPDFGEPDNAATLHAVDRGKGAWERIALRRVLMLPEYACSGQERRRICSRRPRTDLSWTRQTC